MRRLSRRFNLDRTHHGVVRRTQELEVEHAILDARSERHGLRRQEARLEELVPGERLAALDLDAKVCVPGLFETNSAESSLGSAIRVGYRSGSLLALDLERTQLRVAHRA